MSFDLDMDGGYENGRSTPPKRPQGKRHILTPEERARGHKLTRADCVKGAIAANRIRGARGGRAAHAKGTAHALTAEERRKGGLATAAKRRAKRERDLIALAQGKANETHGMLDAPGRLGHLAALHIDPQPIPDPGQAPELGNYSAADLTELGASLTSKLMEPPRPSGGAEDLYLPREYEREGAPIKLEVVAGLLTTDPFILSALKRFRLGPVTPFQLTRSQRAHVDIMREAGYIEATGDSMLQLTSKGREAITNATPDE